VEERNVNVAYSMDLSGLTGEEGDVSSTLQILLEERRLIDGRAAFISAVDVNPGEIVTVDDIIVVAILGEFHHVSTYGFSSADGIFDAVFERSKSIRIVASQYEFAAISPIRPGNEEGTAQVLTTTCTGRRHVATGAGLTHASQTIFGDDRSNLSGR